MVGDIEQAFRNANPVTEPLSNHIDIGYLLTIEEYRESVACGAFIDYDGFGNLVRNDRVAVDIETVPSKIAEIPVWVTHILWYNR